MALGNCDSMVSRLFCPVRRSQNCEKCFGRNQRKATQSHFKAHTKPPQSHILGIDSGVQRHPKANLKPPQGHPTATPRLHQSHTKAPPKPHQGSTKATPKPGKCGPTTRRWGRTRAVTLTGGEAAHLRTATSRRLDLPSGRALRLPWAANGGNGLPSLGTRGASRSRQYGFPSWGLTTTCWSLFGEIGRAHV